MKAHQFVNISPKGYPLTVVDKASIVKGIKAILVKGNIY